MAAVGERGAAIEDADVIEAEESAFENIFASGIFPIHPPGESDQQFVEDCFQKCAVAFAGLLALDLVNAPGRPADDRRIDIAEVPFVGGNLAVGMLIPFAHDDIELAFGEVRIDQGEGNAMKSEVPGSIPGKFPGIRHRHDALVVKMAPLGVAAVPARRPVEGACRIALQPFLHHVIVELFGPKQPGERLALDRLMLRQLD